MSVIPQIHPRRLARELALLSISQINTNHKKENIQQENLNDLITSAIRTLKDEIQEVLEKAATEVKRSNDCLINSETKTDSLESAKTMIKDALELTQAAINRLGAAAELPELIQLSQKHEVREYTLQLIATVHRRKKEIEAQLESSIVEWQLNRLSRIDRDILKIATAEIMFLEVAKKIAINEAVELAKRYSDEEGYKFINGVLRRVTDQIKTAKN